MGLLPWSPLAGGFLAGKYQRGTKPASDTRAGSEKPLYQWTSAEYAESDQNWNTIETVVKIAREIGVSPAQVALSWLSNRPSVVAPIFGARSVAHLRDNLGAADLHLPVDATAELEKVSTPRSGGYPYGAFGTAQRSRSIDGSAPLQKVVGKGSAAPLG
jgi:aryl-alcohol dehydrogenase (NADP+)